MTSADRTWLLVILSGRLGSMRNEAVMLRETAQGSEEMLKLAEAYERDAVSCRRIIDWIESSSTGPIITEESPEESRLRRLLTKGSLRPNPTRSALAHCAADEIERLRSELGARPS